MKTNELHIKGPFQLEAEMCRYNCATKEELEQLLSQTYNIILVYED